MEEKIKFKKMILSLGQSKAITIPPQLLEFLDIKEGDPVIMTGECKSKGKFLAIWKKPKEGE